MVHCPTNGGTIGMIATSKDDAPGRSTTAAIAIVVAVVGVTATVPIPCE